MIRITTEDVGATQAATIWVGEERVLAFYTGTRHADYSLQIASDVLASALRDIIMPRVQIYEGGEF